MAVTAPYGSNAVTFPAVIAFTSNLCDTLQLAIFTDMLSNIHQNCPLNIRNRIYITCICMIRSFHTGQEIKFVDLTV